jgi:hypothetical protein
VQHEHRVGTADEVEQASDIAQLGQASLDDLGLERLV